jgi:hypothetical protein
MIHEIVVLMFIFCGAICGGYIVSFLWQVYKDLL